MFQNHFLKYILTQGNLVEFIRKLLDDVWMITDISETTHQIGTKISGPCALNVKNISQKRKFQLVHSCKNYYERRRSYRHKGNRNAGKQFFFMFWR
jgi:hypothetical protein